LVAETESWKRSRVAETVSGTVIALWTVQCAGRWEASRGAARLSTCATGETKLLCDRVKPVDYTALVTLHEQRSASIVLWPLITGIDRATR
jgi:hypothetical protein